MKKISVFSHDAGGSEILLELIKVSLNMYEFSLFCTKDSPCEKLIKDKNLLSYINLIEPSKESIFSALNKIKPDMILYATSWQNHTEYHFLSYARKNNLPSVAFLDNWTNYRERFGYPDNNWRENFPDFIATHDEQSQALANSFHLPNTVSIKNYSLINQLKNFENIPKKGTDTLLFLSEPTAKVALKTFHDAKYWGFDETDVFKSILQNQEKLDCEHIVIRLHPSDISKTYTNINPNITISTTSLEEDIANAKVVVGIDSSVLYLAFLLGKKVIAFMPSKNRNFHVPLPKTNQTRALESIEMASLITNDKKVKNFGIEFALFVKKTLG